MRTGNQYRAGKCALCGAVLLPDNNDIVVQDKRGHAVAFNPERKVFTLTGQRRCYLFIALYIFNGFQRDAGRDGSALNSGSGLSGTP